jgi:hypothetical protein
MIIRLVSPSASRCFFARSPCLSAPSWQKLPSAATHKGEKRRDITGKVEIAGDGGADLAELKENLRATTDVRAAVRIY